MYVRDVDGQVVWGASEVARKVNGTVSSAGDNTVIDVSALPGYQVGDRILLLYVLIQNKSGLSTESTLVDSGTTESLLLVYGEQLSEGVAASLPEKGQLMLAPDSDLILNLSAANPTNYSLIYHLVVPG